MVDEENAGQQGETARESQSQPMPAPYAPAESAPPAYPPPAYQAPQGPPPDPAYPQPKPATAWSSYVQPPPEPPAPVAPPVYPPAAPQAYPPPAPPSYVQPPPEPPAPVAPPQEPVAPFYPPQPPQTPAYPTPPAAPPSYPPQGPAVPGAPYPPQPVYPPPPAAYPPPGGVYPPPEFAAMPPPPRKRRWPFFVVLGVVIVALLGVAAYALMGRSEKASAAALAPADSAAFVQFDLAPSSTQKSRLNALLAKFPAAKDQNTEKVIESLVAKAAEGIGLDYASDIKPWLGSKAAAAVIPSAGEPTAVLLVEVKNEAKAKAALDKARARTQNQTVVYEFIKGWAVISDRRSDLDAVRKAAGGTKGSLEGAAAYKDAVAKLPADRLALAYFDPAKLLGMMPGILPGMSQGLGMSQGQGVPGMPSMAPSLPGNLGIPGLDFSSLGNLGVSAVALRAEENSLVLESIGTATDMTMSGGEAKLTKALPKETLGVLTFFDLKSAITKAESRLATLKMIPGLGSGLDGMKAQLHQATGLDFDKDILPWLGGEVSVVFGGIQPPAAQAGIPNFQAAIVVQPTDMAAARRTLEKLKAFAEASQLPVQDRSSGGAIKYVMTIAGVPEVAATLDSQRLVIGTNLAYVERLAAASGAKLGDDPAYQAALGNASGETLLQVYLSVGRIKDAVLSMLGPEAERAYQSRGKEYLDPLDSISVRATRDGKFQRTLVVVRVRK